MAERELSTEDRAIVDEEEALYARARAVVSEAMARAPRRKAAGELRSVDALRGLRDDALAASSDDLGPLMLEMSVRQALIERARDTVYPDPAAPYFAHLRLREGGRQKDYLLGGTSFLDGAADVRIVDWRVAPVARIFYRYAEGEDYEEEFPGRLAEGTVEARRIVVFSEGRLVRIVGPGKVLERGADGHWVRADGRTLAWAAGGAGSAVRPGGLGTGARAEGIAGSADITALLDKEQFAAVSAPAEEPLLVLGSAGSGKTTVALHRLARITAAEPASYPLARARVVVPEEGLARLSRRLLEPLGGGGTQVRTLDAWALELAREVFGEVPRLCADPPALVTSLKRHRALFDALRARKRRIAPKNTTLPRLRRRLATLLTDRPFLEGVVAASNGELPRAAVEETVRHTMLQLASPLERELRAITVPEMKRALDGRPIAEGTPDDLAGTIDAEDLPILLFLRAEHAGLEVPRVSHLVLDEAEDFSLFELFVFGKLLGDPPSVTLAGDEAQQTLSSFAGWDRALQTLGVARRTTCRLSVSYRCPRPIAELAHAVLGPLAPEAPPSAARDGVPVNRFELPHEAQAHLFVAGALRDLVGREPRASIAVLTKNREAADRFYPIVADLPSARLVTNGAFSFEPGVDVTEVDEAKGLEFDYVVVLDASAETYPATDEARRRLHVAITRASHQLWLVSAGPLSPLVANVGGAPV